MRNWVIRDAKWGIYNIDPTYILSVSCWIWSTKLASDGFYLFLFLGKDKIILFKIFWRARLFVLDKIGLLDLIFLALLLVIFIVQLFFWACIFCIRFHKFLWHLKWENTRATKLFTNCSCGEWLLISKKICKWWV